jgi:anaerobic selenocysteine-containing dehydrogenase
LADRLGYGYLYPQTEDEMVDFVIGDLPFGLDEFKERSKHGPVFLVPENEIPVYMRGGEEKKWVSGKLRPDGKPGFPTPSGKWEIASSTLEGYGFAPLPEYMGVKGGPENQALAKDFPLALTTGARLRQTFRSQHLNIPGLLKRQPKAEAIIHPNDAAPRGIESGDTVSLKTPRGAVTLCARVTENILEGVVEANMGGGSPIQGEGWKNSNINTITDDRHRDPISGFPIFKALRCELEKVGREH